jgi:hypothetical protein
MVNISEYAKAQSTYLKAKDVVDSKTKVFTITAEGKIVPTNFENKAGTQLQLEGEMDAIEYKFGVSKTSTRVISAVLGDDTAKWIGSQLVLETYKTKNSKNVLVDAINIKEVKKIV